MRQTGVTNQRGVCALSDGAKRRREIHVNQTWPDTWSDSWSAGQILSQILVQILVRTLGRILGQIVGQIGFLDRIQTVAQISYCLVAERSTHFRFSCEFFLVLRCVATVAG